MIFGRRADRRPRRFDYRRVLVAVGGTEADQSALRLVALLLNGTDGEASLLHVIEVPFERQLDVEDEDAVARADQLLDAAAAILQGEGVSVRRSVVQARAAGAAIVDDAVEGGADLIVMGLGYKRRFGGAWDAGRTVPYVMRNSTAPVWCLRAETQELAQTT
jgi:nucleotide-binding universal stress UspA family protein